MHNVAFLLLVSFQFIIICHSYFTIHNSRTNIISSLLIDTTTQLYMSKDGKSKKKKKSNNTHSHHESSTSVADTTNNNTVRQRVSNQINIPIRQQIAWGKAYKRFMQSQTSTNSNSAPKKFKQINELKEQEEYVEIDYKNTRPPAVFVDGYNIIGKIYNRLHYRLQVEQNSNICHIICVHHGYIYSYSYNTIPTNNYSLTT